MNNYVVFDPETAKITPDIDEIRTRYAAAKEEGASPETLAEIQAEGERAKNIKNFRPLGISCAALYASNGFAKLYHGSEGLNGELATQMSVAQCHDLAYDLVTLQNFGMDVITFNGLGFDFDILDEECGNGDWRGKLANLAMNHIDIMFAFLCDKGFPISLKAACAGMGLEGKLAGMDGAKAPVMWRQGREAQDKVLKYCAQDVRATAELYEAILERGRLDWISKRGKPCKWMIDGGIKTVREAIETPLPDTGWMTRPMDREDFYEWCL